MPTYNEADNIVRLLDLIYGKENRAFYLKKNIVIEVLVVDDNSPDGTASQVLQYMEKSTKVHLLSRTKKEGLGAAYIAGIQHALTEIKPDILFEMDADMSHNPKYISRMIMGILDGADLVIGSRYTKNGSVPYNWGLVRKLVSSTANTYARLLLGIFDVKDCTGGFRAIRASLLQKIDLNSLSVKGYAFQISLLHAILRNNGIVREIPIDFNNRISGKSKMRIRDIIEVGLTVLKISLQKLFIHAPAVETGESVYEDAEETATTVKT